jgi:Protein of unknown function (DUF1360)
VEFWLRFVIAVLAIWRVTHLLAREDGPARLVLRLRRALGNGAVGHLLDCFKCLSLWVAAPFACSVTLDPLPLFVTWLAGSGAAMLLEEAITASVVIEPLPSGTEEEHADDVLRTRPDEPR